MVSEEAIFETQTQEIIDAALDLLSFHLKIKLPAIAAALNDFGIPAMTNLKLSRVRSLHRTDGLHEYKGSEGLNALGERESLSVALRRMLLEKHGIPFENGVFLVPQAQGKPPKRWGKLLVDPSKKKNKKGNRAKEAEKQPQMLSIAPINHGDIYKSFKKAQDIRIVHTYLTASDAFVNFVKEAIENNPSIRFSVLTMKLNSESLRLREKSLADRQDEHGVMLYATAGYKMLKKLASSYPNNFRLRTFNESSGSFFIIDKTIYTCFQWHGVFADEGPYLQTFHSPENPFAERIHEHFNDLWESAGEPKFDLQYKMYLIRNGELRHPELLINSKSFDASLTHTSTASTYHGSVIRAQGECCNIFLQEEMEAEGQSRVAFMLTNTQRERLDSCELAIGLYTVELKHQKSFNLVLLENTKAVLAKALSDEEKIRLSMEYLTRFTTANDNSEILLAPGINSWESLRNALTA